MSATDSTSRNAKLLRLATYASVITAIVLIVAKLLAWLWTDSVSLLATLIDSTLDAAASIMNLLAVRHSLQPADKEHRFGHGKAESLAGLGQSTFIAGSAGFLFLQAVGRLLHPQQPQVVGVGIAVMVFSIFVTITLLLLQRHVVAKTASTAIKADSLHYQTDVLMNISVIIALVLSSQGWPGFDPLFAIVIVFFILYSAKSIAVESIQDLMDRELPDDDRKRIESTVLSHKSVRGMHDLRTRRSGTISFIQLHLELDDELTLARAHEISDDVEADILKEFPNAEVIIHADPTGVVESIPEFTE
ncbi:MAG: cation diffusion facilitator family transporter [Gammaproteobacteria bacterium]